MISVAEVLSARVGNCEAPETLREAGMAGKVGSYVCSVEWVERWLF